MFVLPEVKVNGLPLFEGDMVMDHFMLQSILDDETIPQHQRNKLNKVQIILKLELF